MCNECDPVIVDLKERNRFLTGLVRLAYLEGQHQGREDFYTVTCIEESWEDSDSYAELKESIGPEYFELEQQIQGETNGAQSK